MSKPKRHHYVPQFYLRRFSDNGRSIYCYNKAGSVIFPNASIKGQCAIDNYYGWDDSIEKTFGVVEGKVASLIREIVATNALPHQQTEEWQFFLMFLALQSARTKLSGDESDLMTDYVAKLFAKGSPELDQINLDDFMVKSTYPTALPIQVSAQAFGYLGSLGRALIINQTPFKFFCSDNPVVLYNSQRAYSQDNGVIGLDSLGLQVIFPLDPTHALYLYDARVYPNAANTRSRKIGLEDVAKFNFLQYLWSDQNVYFSDSRQSDLVRLVADISLPYASYRRVEIRESDISEHEDGTNSSLLHQFRAHAPIETYFSFGRSPKYRDDGRNYGRSDIQSDIPVSNGVERAFRFSSSTFSRKHLRGPELSRGLRSIANAARQM